MLRLLPFLPYAIIAIVHVVLLALDDPLTVPTKLLLMPMLAFAVLWSAGSIRRVGMSRRANRVALAVSALLLGIALSWLGDGSAVFFPMFSDAVPMMLLCFGLAHVVYVLLMWRGRGIATRGFPRWSIVFVAAYIVLMIVLVPRAGALAVPVAIYGLLLVATAAFASRCGPVVAWGGVWFLVSDAILAFRLFMPESMPGWTSPAVMITYALGQGLIAYGIVATLRQRAEAVVLVSEMAERA